MANNPIYLNGQQLRPSSIERTATKVGTSQRMADGTLRYFHRANKSSWTITWEGVTEDILTIVRNVYTLTTSFTFIDEQATSFTVLCEGDALKYTLSATKIALGGHKRYDVTLTVNQV